MRKVLILAAMVAMMAATVVAPAMAQDFDIDDDNDFDGFFFNGNGFDRFDRFGGFDQDFEQDAESGDVELEFSTENTGDNSNVCAPALQFANTGNVQNEQGFTSIGDGFFGFDDFDGDFFDFDGFDNGDVDFEGSTVTFEPELDTTCEQSVQQSSAASSD